MHVLYPIIVLMWLMGCGETSSKNGDETFENTNTDADADGDTDTDGDADTDGDTDTDSDTDSDADTDGDADTDSDTDSDSDSDSDSDTDTDSDTDGDTDMDTDSDTDTDTDTDSDPDSESESDSDSNIDSDHDTEADTDSDTDADTDSDTDTEIDTDIDTDVDAVTKRNFDFVVGVDGDFLAAMNAASGAGGSRFVIFFPQGEYNIGSLTGDANQMTTFTPSNVSFIGQSSANTTIYNSSINEGISITATLSLRGDNAYFQDLTIMNRANYGDTASYNVTGRHVAMMEQANHIIYKNTRLLSTQDTYYTKGSQTYWEGGEIHGTTDFICGDGDIYFNGVLLWVMKKSAMLAPKTNTHRGYVFNNCTLDGTLNGFDLGRSWGAAKAVLLNTTMKQLPSDRGWGDPMNSVPQLFAEFNSMNESGSPINLSSRRTSYTKDATTVTLNPVLSASEAAQYTIENVLDGWHPTDSTKQVAAPVIQLDGSNITWADAPNALCWAVFVNGQYIANTTSNRYDISALASGDVVTVRAANKMGGLGRESNALDI